MAEKRKPDDIEPLSDDEVEDAVGGVVLDNGSGMRLTSAVDLKSTESLQNIVRKSGEIVIKGKDIL